MSTMDGPCERWSAVGPCGWPAVERLHYANEWMDHPGQPGLALCRGHLNEYMADQLVVFAFGPATGWPS